MIVHGGTIMAIMEAEALLRGNYYDYQIQNGAGYILRQDGSFTALED
jgi:alpha-ribazole phosphatase